MVDREPWYDGREQRLRRLAAGLDQRALSERSGVGQPVISKIENGHQQPTPATAAKIAAALSCQIADLMHGRPQSQDAEAVGA